jgi:hypothetical protein
MVMNVLKTLATAIGGIAPTIATMLGGPLAGTAVKALAGALGLADNATPEDITKAVGSLSPDQIAMIRKADQEHAEKMEQLGIDLKKLNADHEEAMLNAENADRASARQREVAVKDNTPKILAALVMIAATLVGVLVLTGQVTKDPSLAVQVGIVVGYVFSEAKAVLSYYFGSSTGSKIKDQTIADQAIPKVKP